MERLLALNEREILQNLRHYLAMTERVSTVKEIWPLVRTFLFFSYQLLNYCTVCTPFCISDLAFCDVNKPIVAV